MALFMFAFSVWLLIQGATGTSGCQQLAVCDTEVAWVSDLHEETADTVLVSGGGGLARCQLTGGQGQVIQGPWGTQLVTSALVTDDDVMWVVGRQAQGQYGPFHLYSHKATGSWQRELEDDNLHPSKLDNDNNGFIAILTQMKNAIYYVQPSQQPTIVSTLNLTGAATWRSPSDLTVLPSGRVAVTDVDNHCAHIVRRDGTLENTMGTCGSPGSALEQFHGPLGITTDHKGNILIADTNNHRISVFNSTGSLVTTICQGELWYPRAALVTSGGYLVVGQKNQQVRVYNYKI